MPKALSDLVMQLLEKPPEKRPASAKVVAQRLAELEEDRTVAEPRRSFPSLRCGAEGSGKSGRSLPGLAAKLLTMICGLAWRLVRRFGRTGLVIQGAAAALVLLVVLLLLMRPGSEESGDSGRVDDKYITNSIGMKLAYIPAGKFLMGSTADEIERLKKEPHRVQPDRWDQLEGPQHEVRITKPFYMGVHEVTVGQFRQFVKETRYQTEAEKSGGAHRHFPDGSWKQDPAGNWLNPGFDQTDDHPVVCVSWNDAREFCDWLTRKEASGSASAPRGTYRLPTEAEWEYACRAGSTTRYSCGDDKQALREFANVADESIQQKWPFPYPNGKEAWNDGHAFTAPVGRFKPNAFGLHDMHGNVWEWCLDGPRTYPTGGEGRVRGPIDDPVGDLAGGLRVLRGGCWRAPAWICRSALRSPQSPSFRASPTGFRVVWMR